MEIKNMNEYNPDYHKDGTLVWKEIGEKTGKKGIRKQKQFNHIEISKIMIPEGMKIDKEILEASRCQYEETHKMIPIYLSYDFVLLAGYEQIILAHELGKKEVCFQRVNKINRKEAKKFRNSVQHRKIGSKKYPIKDRDGNRIYITMAQRKILNACYGLARKVKMKIEITPDLKIDIIKMDGSTYKDNLSLKTAKNQLNKLHNNYKQTE